MYSIVINNANMQKRFMPHPLPLYHPPTLTHTLSLFLCVLCVYISLSLNVCAVLFCLFASNFQCRRCYYSITKMSLSSTKTKTTFSTTTTTGITMNHYFFHSLSSSSFLLRTYIRIESTPLPKVSIYLHTWISIIQGVSFA